MGIEWIKMRRSLLTDPKVVRIMSALQADRFRTIGGLFSAWCLFDEHTEDGQLDGYSKEVFDEIVGFRGLCQAMIDVGWIEESAQGLTAINFTEHNGRTARKRAQDSVRKMSAREADKKAANERTRKEKKRKENTHTHAGSGAPEELATDWDRWMRFRESVDGRRMDPIQADAVLMDLGRRGVEKAKRDIDFSIQKGAKTILDSDNDFTRRNQSSGSKKMKSVAELLGKEAS